MSGAYVQDSDFTLHVGDVRDVLAGIPDGSVDCVVTSPPYWGLRDYGSEGQIGLEPTPEAYVEQILAVFRQVRRVLADHGTCWLNLGHSYAGHNLPGWRDGNEVKNGGVSNKNGVGYIDGLKPKDLVGIPWRVAFALQADGWYLRSDIIWSKPNPMPESVTDRPTKAHEYVFLLSKQPRYFFDQEAVREPAEWARWGDQTNGKHGGTQTAAGWIGSKSKEQLQGGRQARRYSAENFKTTDERNTRYQGPNPTDGGRNVRSVWEIATQPYPEAHFATFPEALAERCIKAGCPEWVCGTCGKARERIIETSVELTRPIPDSKFRVGYGGEHKTKAGLEGRPQATKETVGWSDCGHDNYRPGRVLDPFMGSGTVALVARNQRRHSIGIELNEEYARLCAKRLQQLSLLAEGTM